ncbi:MAG: phosphoadenosine phosphosulfate reductase family protein [Caldilineaceae bacterium]|nr:phosphoadenosine phosphosulfate reductase family protein [Caldilineaceae bacterium]
MRTQSLFEADRLTLPDAIDLSVTSLNAYGERYRHWAIAYSGGKDSTATLAFVLWALQAGRVAAPESLTVLYADTRMELPPLRLAALRILHQVQGAGYRAEVVLPAMDDRFYVYMLGRGVPPPKNRFRWCTPQLKIEPMHAALAELRQQANAKLLMLTGVRLGESAARDQRIAVSCSKDSGECGQGWFQVATPESIADTLAPLLHWRLCHVFDWLYFEQERHGFDTSGVAAVYGDEDIRTGCVGCNLASRDNSLERLLRQEEWQHLRPLMELRPLYAELTKPRWRKRKLEPEMRQDGQWSANPQRMGPLTMAGRAYGLERVLDIQQRAGVDLISIEEEERIRELWRLDTWPNKWTSADIDASVPVDAKRRTDSGIATQTLLVR